MSKEIADAEREADELQAQHRAKIAAREQEEDSRSLQKRQCVQIPLQIHFMLLPELVLLGKGGHNLQEIVDVIVEPQLLLITSCLQRRDGDMRW